MATCRQRGNTYHFVIKRKGLLPRPIYHSFDDRAEGEAWAKEIEALLDRGIVPASLLKTDEDLPTNVKELITVYIRNTSVPQSEVGYLMTVVKDVGNVDLKKIEYEWVEKWVNYLKRTRNLSPTTIKHYIGSMARCFDWSIKKTYVPNNPFRMLPKRYATYTPADCDALGEGMSKKEEQHRDRRLAASEEESIRKVLSGKYLTGRERTLPYDPGFELMFNIAIETGMRLSEIYTLERQQIDLTNATIFLDRTKNGDRRQVALSSIVIEHLKAIELPESGYILAFGGPKNKKTTDALSRRFSRVCEHAKVDDFHFHDLRHEYTSRLYERTTLSDVEIAKQLGWKSLKMALRYANLRASTLSKKLW